MNLKTTLNCLKKNKKTISYIELGPKRSQQVYSEQNRWISIKIMGDTM